MPSHYGDRSEEFERLFRKHYPAVAGYVARRAEAAVVDDLVAEVFLIAWRRMDQVPDQPKSWLLTVARNVLGTHIRGAQRGRALHAKLADSDPKLISDEPVDVDVDVAAALAGLRPKDREALLLVNWEELTPSEAARVLCENPTAFRVRLHRAKARFRAAIEEQQGTFQQIGVADPILGSIDMTKEAPDA